MAASRFVAGLHTTELPAGHTIVRIHPLNRGPIFFGPLPGKMPQSRFDAPNSEFRVLYTAEQLEGAFVETMLRRPTGRILRRDHIEERGWSLLRPKRPLALAKLYDEGLQVHQIDAGEISVNDYGPSRALALALHSEFGDLDGLAYRSRYNNGEICYAVFDRITIAEFDVEPVSAFVDFRDRVDALMEFYGAVFDTSPPIA